MKKLLLLLILCISIASCGCSGEKGIKRGQTVIVTEECIGAIDEDSFDKMVDKCVDKDEIGLEIMESQGKITIIPAGENGFVTKTGFGKVKIRLDNLKEYWCDSKFVK